MLFDLRGRGRRRTVQAVYLTLALLLGGGLVLFGIGGDVQGGLFDAFREDSQGTQASDQIERQIDRAEAAAAASPRDPRRLAALARLRYQAAGIGSGFDQNAGTFTQEGRTKLRGAAQAWERYLALEPENPDDRVAGLMVQAYGPGGLNQLGKAVRAQEIVTEQREPPSSNLFAQLAVLSYQADQTRKGDLAADRALELAEKSERSLLRQQLEQAKTQATAQNAPQGSTPAQPAAPPGG
ncbi:MAG: hypothetical protein H0T43_10945 [Solirubrobacterales bacterium]|nr:hypothetical protein [Solirubrobacterales bacterium]